tara:strand:+ start:103 stop:324 length:222 start_codon:yes stop_codon:yes gene_type:complete
MTISEAIDAYVAETTLGCQYGLADDTTAEEFGDILRNWLSEGEPQWSIDAYGTGRNWFHVAKWRIDAIRKGAI